MKLGVFSDLHLRNYKEFSTPLGFGINTRAAACLNVLDELKRLVQERDWSAILFAGDFFDSRGSVEVSLAIAARTWIRELAGTAPLFMIGGQHDAPTKETGSPSAIHLFDDIPGVFIVSTQASKVSDGVEVCGINGEDPLEPLSPVKKGSGHRILLLHKTLVGAKVNDSFSIEDGLSKVELEQYLSDNDVDMCFIGDIHLRQKISECIWYVGNCIQKDFGEGNQKKGVLEYEIENGVDKVSFVPIPSPNFITVKGKSAKQPSWLNQTDYFRVLTDSKEQFESWSGKAPNVRTIPPVEVLTKDRSGISMKLGNEEILKQYVKLKASPERQDDLVKLGLECLSN